MDATALLQRWATAVALGQSHDAYIWDPSTRQHVGVAALVAALLRELEAARKRFSAAADRPAAQSELLSRAAARPDCE